MKSNHSVWAFLVLGIALRCVALNQPLIDAHLLRQCQTAAATKNLIAQPGFHLSSKIPWLGDLDAYYILELPLYNYLVMGVNFITGNLDLSGKITSILLWAASFICLQFIWRRVLDPKQAFWANLLFVVSPFEIFWGQAFMTEMLVQTIAFGFVVLAMRYSEKPTLLRLMTCASVGLLGLLVKLPETAHLYLILAFIVFRREHWKALLWPRFLVAALITVMALKAWSGYVDSVNAAHLPEWTSKPLLAGFVGPLESRFHLKPWILIILYLGAFAAPGAGALAILYGAWILWKKRDRPILEVWLLALVIYYMVWLGNAGSAQSYYNLPALAPLCALFGIGMRELLEKKWILQWRRLAAVSAALLVVLCMVPAWRYLFHQDRQIFDAAQAVKARTKPTDLILFRPNHRFDMVEYPYNPVFEYYSQRPTFIWTKNTPEQYRAAALERARYAAVTLPPSPPSGILGAYYRFRGVPSVQSESPDWLEAAGFRAVEKNQAFVIYERPN